MNATIVQDLMTFRRFAKTTYLMLMMVDREGRVPVLQRYNRDQEFEGVGFRDPGWPVASDLKVNMKLEEQPLNRSVHAIREAWPVKHA